MYADWFSSYHLLQLKSLGLIFDCWRRCLSYFIIIWVINITFFDFGAERLLHLLVLASKHFLQLFLPFLDEFLMLLLINYFLLQLGLKRPQVALVARLAWIAWITRFALFVLPALVPAPSIGSQISW